MVRSAMQRQELTPTGWHRTNYKVSPNSPLDDALDGPVRQLPDGHLDTVTRHGVVLPPLDVDRIGRGLGLTSFVVVVT